MGKQEPWITVAEAAKRLMVSCETIRRWTQRGYLKGYWLPSGRLRVIESSLARCAATKDRRAV